MSRFALRRLTAAVDRAPVARRSRTAYRLAALTLALALFLSPRVVWACACGCGLFDVGTGTMMPTGEGGTAFLEWDYMDQNRNWSGTHKSAASNNSDIEINTHFITAGAQYFFNRSWGAMVEIPYWNRDFTTTDANNNVVTFNTHDIGDVRLKGMYTGFSEDMSTGLTYGVKLPTGNYTAKGFDRDTQIGTGSTDLLIGGYHVGALTEDNKWNWFVNAQGDLPVLKTTDYRPGEEIDGLLGVYYNDLSLANDTVKLAPIAQAKASYRWRDYGATSNSPNSGYQRLLLSPGLEVDVDRYRLYADVSVPVYTHAHGNQLVATQLFKLVGSVNF